MSAVSNMTCSFPSRISAVFWEQQGLQTFGQRIQITRPHASQPAFERHFAQLTEEYGSIHAINLLGTKENEAILTSTYARHLQVAKSVLGDDIGITHFDFHAHVRVGGHDSVPRELRCVLLFSLRSNLNSMLFRRIEGITSNVDKFGFSMCDASSDEVVTEQKGVFRTNCLDWYVAFGFPIRFRI